MTDTQNPEPEKPIIRDQKRSDCGCLWTTLSDDTTRYRPCLPCALSNAGEMLGQAGARMREAKAQFEEAKQQAAVERLLKGKIQRA